MRPVPNVPREMIDEIIRKKKLELAARQITRLANLIGIYSGDDTSTTTAVTKNDKKKSTTLSKNKVNDNEDGEEDNDDYIKSISHKNILKILNIDPTEIKIDDKDDEDDEDGNDKSITTNNNATKTSTKSDPKNSKNNSKNNSNATTTTTTNEPNNSKHGSSITVDTNVNHVVHKEQRYMTRSPASPRLIKKRAIIRRANSRIIPIHTKYSSESSIDYQRSNKKKEEKTDEISNELEVINTQFQETLNQFSKRYQDSTVVLAEKSHLLKRNQELMHAIASKEAEIEYLKGELWEAGNKIQNYEIDIKDLIEQQHEPLALTQEDLLRIEKEINDKGALVSSYQQENDKLVNELKKMNEQFRHSNNEQGSLINRINELSKENEQLKELFQENKVVVPGETMQQMEEMKKEIENLKEKEKTLEFKEMALKEMEGLKKEVNNLRDRGTEDFIKIDELERKLSEANEEIEQINLSKTASLEKLTEEMNIMKYTYESQIEKIKKEANSKEARETRFRKLQNALDKVEDMANNNSPEFEKIYNDLRRIRLLQPKKRRKSFTDASSSKDLYGYSKEPPRSPTITAKSLKRSTSQSSIGGLSRSNISRTASPTPSVVSNISAKSGRTDLTEDDAVQEYIDELNEKNTKLEDELRVMKEKFEKDSNILNEEKSKLKEEIENIKKEHKAQKEEYDRKMHEMEELLLEMPADTTESSSTANVSSPVPPPQPMPSINNLLNEIEIKQAIIEELVAKLKKKEEQLEYYQNAYLLKTEEFEDYVEKTQAAQIDDNMNGNSPPIVATNNNNDLSLLPITSDIMDLFEISAIEQLIAQLERTIIERTTERDAAHQRATEAEAKLVAFSKEKMNWGSGYDTSVKKLKVQVQHLQELLQMERKANLRKLKHEKLCNQVELLTRENTKLKSELIISEKIRELTHDNTLKILKKANKSSLIIDNSSNDDIVEIKKSITDKEMEINVLKGKCIGLESVIKKQRELLASVIPSVFNDGDNSLKSVDKALSNGKEEEEVNDPIIAEEMEAQLLNREKKLQEVIDETKRHGEVQIERLKSKWNLNS
ncbi:10424_t:CDS:2 [Entrophospora sp. SA101]|nr:10424_t:CDS:2 [Entrophospora sp. SA101]